MPNKIKGIHTFLMAKLPSAYFTGVRLKSINDTSCITTVKFRWINQNPFKSMFWAIQGMAAELSTGALVMGYIKEFDTPISMLVLNNKGNFSKKARGRITFTCNDGLACKAAIAKAIETGEGQTIWMESKGVDEAGDLVSTFHFEWTLRTKR